MSKATFVRQYIGDKYEQHMIYTDYMYRGKEYTVYENRAKGNEPLSWQHKSHQAEINAQIEAEAKRIEKPYRYEDTAEYGFEVFWDYVNS